MTSFLTLAPRNTCHRAHTVEASFTHGFVLTLTIAAPRFSFLWMAGQIFYQTAITDYTGTGVTLIDRYWGDGGGEGVGRWHIENKIVSQRNKLYFYLQMAILIEMRLRNRKNENFFKISFLAFPPRLSPLPPPLQIKTDFSTPLCQATARESDIVAYQERKPRKPDDYSL